jgi:hypothetical protein
MDGRPNIIWSEVEASFLDSEGDQNVLSDEEDLKVASRYRDVKKLSVLEISIQKRRVVSSLIDLGSFIPE